MKHFNFGFDASMFRIQLWYIILIIYHLNGLIDSRYHQSDLSCVDCSWEMLNVDVCDYLNMMIDPKESYHLIKLHTHLWC